VQVVTKKTANVVRMVSVCAKTTIRNDQGEVSQSKLLNSGTDAMPRAERPQTRLKSRDRTTASPLPMKANGTTTSEQNSTL
jgi:hypothetical protein